MKVWITKYALTSGIMETEADQSFSELGIIVRGGSDPCSYDQSFYGKDWHLDPESATARAEEMRTKKISYLKKQIAKLEEMKF